MSDFQIENGILKKYTGAGGDVVIPDSVTAIGDRAFAGCESLTAVTIGDSVTHIGWHAFDSCTALVRVTLGERVTHIHNCTFASCTALTSIAIPDTVTHIGWHAFIGCAAMTEVTIGSGVTHIDLCAFASCTALTHVTMGENVTHINDSAFEGCERLTELVLGEKVTHIGSSAFAGCTALANVVLSDHVISICRSAFAGCDSLAFHEHAGGRYLGSRTNPYRVLIAPVDKHCTRFSIHPDTRVIADEALADTDLSEITIGAGVTHVGRMVFRGCTALSRITFAGETLVADQWMLYACAPHYVVAHAPLASKLLSDVTPAALGWLAARDQFPYTEEDRTYYRAFVAQRKKKLLPTIVQDAAALRTYLDIGLVNAKNYPKLVALAAEYQNVHVNAMLLEYGRTFL